MQDFTIGDLGVFIGTIGGVVTSILIVLQKSRCKKIKCCGIDCDREISKEKEKKKKDDIEMDKIKPNISLEEEEEISPIKTP